MKKYIGRSGRGLIWGATALKAICALDELKKATEFIGIAYLRVTIWTLDRSNTKKECQALDSDVWSEIIVNQNMIILVAEIAIYIRFSRHLPDIYKNKIINVYIFVLPKSNWEVAS
jgi:hypothetical protein